MTWRVTLTGLLLTLLGASCSSQDGEPLCLHDCDLCTTGKGCPPDRCGLLVVMSSDCAGRVDLAEVAVDSCLEDGELFPGEHLKLCASIQKGMSGKVTVRGELLSGEENWIWPKTVECTDARAGHIVVLTVSCQEL